MQMLMVQIIFPNGKFEDVYVTASSEEDAKEQVLADIEPRNRRWIRLVV